MQTASSEGKKITLISDNKREMRGDKPSWFCSSVTDGEIGYSLPLQRVPPYRQHTVPVVSEKETEVASRWWRSVDSIAVSSGEEFLFSTCPGALTSLQREIWTWSWQQSPGHRAGGEFRNMMTKRKIKISSFLITLALSVTCGQGWQVMTYSAFYQFKQIYFMWLSHILEFPILGCDLAIC